MICITHLAVLCYTAQFEAPKTKSRDGIRRKMGATRLDSKRAGFWVPEQDKKNRRKATTIQTRQDIYPALLNIDTLLG